MTTAGYSSNPLYKKLGFKENFTYLVIDPPKPYHTFFHDLPQPMYENPDPKVEKDLIHVFVMSSKGLADNLTYLKSQIKKNGMIWVSWPKKSSGVETDVSDGVIRETAIKCGLIDTKVCAVDATWSGLKLMIPVKDR